MSRNRFPTVNEKIEKMKRFYRRENSSPVTGFFLGSEYPNIRYPHYRTLPAGRPLQPDDFEIEPFLEDCEKLWKGHAECGGDLFWTGTPFWGIPWIEAMLGFPLSFNPDGNTITASNPDNQITAEMLPDFSPDNPWVELFHRFFSSLAEHSRGRYPLGTSRIRGLADILSVLFGGEQLAVNAMETPELLRKALDKIAPFYLKLMEFQLKHIPLFHNGMGSFYYYTWTPAETVWHQEDSVMLLSPSIYKDLLFPYNADIYGKIKNNICHFHSIGGYIPYKEIISLKPLAVEMHLDSGGPSAEALYERHMEILATTPLIIWGEFSRDDLDWVFSKLPPQGLALNMVVNSPDEAAEIWEQCCTD
jgi:hypothetical protein